MIPGHEIYSPVSVTINEAHVERLNEAHVERLTPVQFLSQVAVGPGPEDLVNQVTGKLKLY